MKKGLSELEELRGIFRKRMPGTKPTAEDLLPLTSPFLTNPGNFQVVDRTKEKEELKRISVGLNEALSALRSLHPDVRRQLEHEFTARSKSETLKFFAGGEPFHCFDQLAIALEYLQSGANGAIPQVTKAIRNWPSLSPQAEQADTWIKVRLVSCTRKIWERHTGKPAPKISSNGDFLELLRDLVELHRFDWQAESAMRAWSKKEEEGDNWGWADPSTESSPLN